MFYVPELLSKRKKGKLSCCWLAGIMSERLFKTTVTNREIISVDLQESCDEILTVLNSNSNDYRERFSLALSSRLMCGVVKVHYYQVRLFEKSLSLTLYHMQPVDLKGGKKHEKKTTIDLDLDMTDALTIPEPPELNFEDLTFGTDLNLMQEVSPRSLRVSRAIAESAQPTFGPMTVDEVLNFMGTDDWDFREARQGDSDNQQESVPDPTVEVSAHAVSLSSILADMQDAAQRTPKKLAPPSVMQDSTVAEGHAAPHSSTFVNIQDQAQRTTNKRPSTDTLEAESSSKRRRTLDPEFGRAPDHEEAQFSSVLLSIRGEDQSVPFAAAQQEDESNPPSVASLFNDAEDHTTTLPSALAPIREENEEIPLEAVLPQPSIQQVPDLPAAAPREVSLQPEKRRKEKRGSKRIDKYKNIQDNVMKNWIADIEAHTQLPPMAVPEQKRTVPVLTMFKYPASAFEFDADELPSVRQESYAVKLMELFRVVTAEIVVDKSVVSTNKILDYITKNATIEQSTTAKGNKVDSTTSSKDDSEPRAVQDDISRPVDDAQAGPSHAPEFESISNVPLPPMEVTDENTFEDTSKAQPMVDGEQSTVDDAQPIIDLVNEEQISIPNEFLPEALNQDAPPPQLLQGMDEEMEFVASQEKTRQGRGEEIMSLDGQNKAGLETEVSGWTKPDLEACLEVEWRDCPSVPFKKLNPPGETRKVFAASCLSLLLDLRKAKKVVLKQTDEIYIEKAVPSANREKTAA